MRVFGGIFLSKEILSEIQFVKREISKYTNGKTAGLDWVAEENWHITVLPPLNVPSESVDEFLDTAKRVASHIPSFFLTLTNVVWAPPHRRPTMLWIKGPSSADFQVASMILSQHLMHMGIQPHTEHHQLVPHVTLARIAGKGLPPEVSIKLPKIPSLSFEVDSIMMIKSELRPEGSHYTPLKHLFLKKPYEILSHTADIRLKVSGQNYEDLIRNALLGLNAILGGEKRDTNVVSISVDIHAPNFETLLIDVLSKVLAESHVQHATFTDIHISEFTPTRIKAIVRGHTVDKFTRDIKAVTYHNVVVRNYSDHKEVTIVLDI